MPEKILVVDDDAGVRNVLQQYLASHGFAVVHTDNGSEALLLVHESDPDIILVDVAMPGLDGEALCRVIKKAADTHNIPVVLMSGSRIDESDVLSGFEGGADDYIAKPFSLPVLLARLHAVLRRYSATAQHDARLKKAGIEIDPGGRTVTVKGEAITLTRKEFDLLATLLSRSGKMLSIPYLLETVWGYDPADYNDPGTVEVHVSHLRKKLGSTLGKRIVNIVGHGYKFED